MAGPLRAMGLLRQHQVLVLNSSYEAINVCNGRRALLLLMKGVADAVQDSRFEVRSATTSWSLPEVIRLRRYIRIPYRPIPYCRKNVFLRDDYTCQYCGQKKPIDQLTLDHILPTSRGGGDNWNNVVTACRSCNHAKGSLTPEEAQMNLPYRPTHPHLPSFLHLVRKLGARRAQWRKYLYYDAHESAAV